ncbi:hypothetical protein Tco_0628109 [Tanacetum coccineum]|uniref:Uncharacterized protein n=1 Tax=Tanacetum coccineum TaxID=301880 RepID=A0ABQ4WPE4_9ASTR
MSRRYGYMFRHLKQSFMPRKDFNEMVDTVESMMKKVIPLMVNKRVNKFTKKLVPLYVAKGLLLDKRKDQTNIAALVDSFLRDYMLTNTLHVHPTKAASYSIHDLQYQLYLKMKDDEQVRKSIWWSLKIKFEKPAPFVIPYRIAAIRTRNHEYHHDDDTRPKGESSTLEQLDEFDAWMDDFGTDDDEVPSKEISPELLEEISREVDEAQLQKAVIDMLRESRKEDLSLQIPKKPAQVYQSYERDLKALPTSLQNQDLFYLKHGNSRPKKYVLSLHKYPAVPFLKNDIEELTLRWEKKRDNPDEVYSESKIIEVVRTLHDLGYEHKYIIQIVVRRADGNFNAFFESDYKYLYKNDNEDFRYKDCLVENGSTQLSYVDVDENFGPIVKLATIRIVLSLFVSQSYVMDLLEMYNIWAHLDEERKKTQSLRILTSMAHAVTQSA